MKNDRLCVPSALSLNPLGHAITRSTLKILQDTNKAKTRVGKLPTRGMMYPNLPELSIAGMYAVGRQEDGFESRP